MSEIHPNAVSYVSAVDAVKAVQTARKEQFEALQTTWHKFYGLVDVVGREQATATLPDEAAAVEAFEISGPSSNTQRSEILEALNTSLENQMRHLAQASVGDSSTSLIGRLRSDLKELETFRKSHLDGIGGDFWSVAKSGYGADRKEKGRMINRIMSAWCDIYEIKPDVMIKAARTFGQLSPRYHDQFRYPFNSYEPLDLAARYPFSFETDLAEARVWDEFDPEEIDELLSIHARNGGWPEPETDRVAKHR
ncbi:hypothetical protein G6L37_07045 [Agrobacterium rubi]|nr:hypothetical protein [Agrobacterium rubi]NTF25122.1 hypothetical protein [Agrobacterium rubi]